jgi:uncharacterized membrane protein YedE/YeeE
MMNMLIMIAAVGTTPIATLAQTQGTDPLAYSGPAWSPYLVGALIGVLSWLTFYFSNKPLGASTAYACLAGLVGKAVASRKTESLQFYQETPPKIDWEVMLVLGIVIGAFVAAWTGGELTGYWLAPMWESQFGSNIALRLLAAFTGGTLMAFGARLAGGCTSGHGISGALQLSVGSWISLVCFFLGGVPIAMLLFRV